MHGANTLLFLEQWKTHGLLALILDLLKNSLKILIGSLIVRTKQTITSQLNDSHTSECDSLLDVIPSIFSNEQKETLSKFPTMEEIYEVVCNMNQNSAPTLDGFNDFFYSSCWKIIKQDLIER